jgi:hypothetical protein
MPGIKPINEIIIKYVDKSIGAFMCGHRWGQKPIHLNNIIGRIRSSGLPLIDIRRIIVDASKWIVDEISKEKYFQLINESEKEGWI